MMQKAAKIRHVDSIIVFTLIIAAFHNWRFSPPGTKLNFVKVYAIFVVNLQYYVISRRVFFWKR